MSTHSSAATKHVFNFFRTGGLEQVSLETAEDLLALSELDQKLWVALSCPVKGLEIDEKTLALIDADGDGHIHVREVIAAGRDPRYLMPEAARRIILATGSYARPGERQD